MEIKSLKDSLYYRVVDKMIPGLMDSLINNGVTLTQFNMRGSVNMTMLGVETESTSWTDLLEIFNITGFGDNVWASKMLSLKALQMRKFGQNVVLTNKPTESVVGNNVRKRLPMIDLGSRGAVSGLNERAILNGVYGNYTPKKQLEFTNTMPATENFPAWTFSGYNTPQRFYMYEEAVISPMYSELAKLVTPMGYTIARGAPVFYAAHATGMAFEEVTEDDINRLQSGAIYADSTGMVLPNFFNGALRKISFPDIKYVPLIIKINAGSGIDNTPMCTPNGSSKRGAICWMIPVIDDMSPSVTGMLCGYSDSKRYLFEFKDSRYTSTVSYNPIMAGHGWWQEYFKPEGYVDVNGVSHSWLTVPTTGFEVNNKLFKNFLPLLQVPLDVQHFIVNTPVFKDIGYDYDGKNVNVKEADFTVSMFATKVTKDWYRDYYKTGFGLYTPRASNIQTNLLAEWDKLEWNEMGVVIDVNNSTISPQIVSETPMAKKYIKAREKACKDNDWLSRDYAKGITNQSIYNKIVAKPARSGFYSINGLSPSVDFNPTFATGAYTVETVSVSEKYFVFTPVDGEVSKLPVNETSASIVLAELPSGIGFTAEVRTLVETTLNMTVEEKSMLTTAINEMKSPSLNKANHVDGFVSADQLYVPQNNLANSGYPAWRFMSSPYREAMVIECYAQLDKMGDNFVKIINSFTSDVVVNKILAKK